MYFNCKFFDVGIFKSDLSIGINMFGKSYYIFIFWKSIFEKWTVSYSSIKVFGSHNMKSWLCGPFELVKMDEFDCSVLDKEFDEIVKTRRASFHLVE